MVSGETVVAIWEMAQRACAVDMGGQLAAIHSFNHLELILKLMEEE